MNGSRLRVATAGPLLEVQREASLALTAEAERLRTTRPTLANPATSVLRAGNEPLRRPYVEFDYNLALVPDKVGS